MFQRRIISATAGSLQTPTSSGWVFISPCGPMRIPKLGLGGGWGPVTLSGGAAFCFPIIRRFDARACTFAIPLAGGRAIAPNGPLEFCGIPFAHLWTSIVGPVSSARMLKKLWGGSISGALVVLALSGGMRRPARLSTLLSCSPVGCTAGTGSCFAPRFSLRGWFAPRIRAGDSGH
jgi:hypothetical protein